MHQQNTVQNKVQCHLEQVAALSFVYKMALSNNKLHGKLFVGPNINAKNKNLTKQTFIFLQLF